MESKVSQAPDCSANDDSKSDVLNYCTPDWATPTSQIPANTSQRSLSLAAGAEPARPWAQ